MKITNRENVGSDNSPLRVIYVLDYAINGMGISEQIHENEIRKKLKKIAESKIDSEVTISFIYPYEVSSE